MIRNIQRTWFEIWGTETAQNQFLKGLLAFFMVIFGIETAALVTLAMRRPLVLGLSSDQTKVLVVEPPKQELLEAEIKRTTKGYLEAHYHWTFSTIEENFKIASKHVAPQFEKAFLAANQEQLKFAKEKKLSQRFFVSETKLDLKTKRVTVEAERILVVEGLRAANLTTIEVQFDYGARTETNPEGIYVTSEKLISKTSE